MWFNKTKPSPAPAPEPDPAVELQAEIDRQTENLRLAGVAVSRASELVRKIEREKEPLVADVAVLERRNDPALATKLQGRKNDIAALDTQIAAARRDYDQGKANFDQYHAAIEDTKRQAASLNVEVDLASVNEHAAAFQAQLKGYNGGAAPSAIDALKSKIRDTNAHATVDRTVSTDPNAERDAEYLKAAKP